ncbi:DinB family protein [Bacillus sp. OTU530]|uniref:DinB family protein n=1 Tax=Bacillus sp. OTU530 TaxID=3043862 RepID=UPI00313CF9AD
MRHHILSLYDYHVWANKRVFEHLKELPQNVYCQEIQSVFPSISEVLVHIYIVDTVWLNAMSGESFDKVTELKSQLQEKTKGKSLEEMGTMFWNLSNQFKVFFDSQGDLDQTVLLEHPNPNLGRLETNLFELVQHVVNHGTYHRGNITAMLRQLGYPGIMTDHIFYLYATKK